MQRQLLRQLDQSVTFITPQVLKASLERARLEEFSPDELAMHRIWQILSRPALTRLEHFSVGKLRILEVRLSDSSPSVGRPLGNINLPSHCRIVLISREEGVIIPTPSDTLMPRDMILVLLSEYSELEALSDVLGIPKEITGERNIKRIMIAGTSVILSLIPI